MWVEWPFNDSSYCNHEKIDYILQGYDQTMNTSRRGKIGRLWSGSQVMRVLIGKHKLVGPSGSIF